MSRGKNLTRHTCRCPRIMRMADETFAQGAVMCTICQHPFEPDHDEQLVEGR